MGDDLVGCVSLVNLGLEDLHALAGDLGAAQAPDQFFALAAEHGSADYFNPAKISPHCIHSRLPLSISSLHRNSGSFGKNFCFACICKVLSAQPRAVAVHKNHRRAHKLAKLIEAGKDF